MDRRVLGVLLLLIAIGLAAVFLVSRRTSAPERASDETPAADTLTDRAGAPPEASAESPPPEAPPAASDVEGLSSAWQEVDLEEVRRAMPENLYWELSAPTSDERVLRDREEERARWNVEYGKVLSGNASEEEISAYFAHRQRLAADYVEFTSYLIDHYGSKLSDQDVTLLELARRLNLKRLEEYPRKIQEARERKQQQDRAREEWLASQRELGGAESQEK